VNEKSLRRGALIVVLCVALATPAKAGTLQNNARNIIIGVVAAAAGVVVIAVLVIHYSKKQTITGCVNSAGSGMTITDEKDRQIYALSGDTAGIRQGDRMKLRGKKIKSKGADKTLVWEASPVSKDFGACHP